MRPGRAQGGLDKGCLRITRVSLGPNVRLGARLATERVAPARPRLRIMSSCSAMYIPQTCQRGQAARQSIIPMLSSLATPSFSIEDGTGPRFVDLGAGSLIREDGPESV
jgi:hypothetical protein